MTMSAKQQAEATANSRTQGGRGGSLIWRLLRQHISRGQLAGFVLANLFGMITVLLSVQFYEDVAPSFAGEDSFIKGTYVIISKQIAAAGSLQGQAQTFTPDEIAELRRQRFAERVGLFEASQFQVYASIAMGASEMGTNMFFESVPDAFVDVDWPAMREGEVPIILPRSYLALYNFGFAQSQSLPKLSEGVVAMIKMNVRLRGADGRERSLRGRVVGFSTRLNTVLVPQAFMQQMNSELAPGRQPAPTRLIVEVKNPADDALATFIDSHGYELEDNSLDAGRATYFLKIVAAIVIAVGLLISALSFYILMLSIYLLVQKNADKLQNLLLIGYSPARVSLPYQLLTLGLNVGVLLLSVAVVLWIRGVYLDRLWQMFPALSEGSVGAMLVVGVCILVGVSVFNIIAIRRKINGLTKSGS